MTRPADAAAARPRARARARLLAALVLAGLVLPAGARAAPPAAIEPFVATYAWIWRGMTVAATTLELKQTGDTWTYTSRSEPRGIGRVYAQRPRTRSVLRISPEGEVTPLTYLAEDGTRSDERRIALTYDWESHRLHGVYERATVDLPLTPQVQDESSIQVALMVALLRGEVPEAYELVDAKGVREFRYTRAGTETLRTPWGEVATVVYRSQKAYSPRVNTYWCAPDRGYIPLRVQQKRGDDVEWTMQIERLERR